MMTKPFVIGLSQLLIVHTIWKLASCLSLLLTISMGTISSAVAQTKVYNPVALPPSNEVADTLTEKDIPTGEGGFARDYMVKFNKGDSIAIDLTSESFDALLSLLSANGATIAENDDGPDGTTNALLFTRIQETGTYTIRVQSFGKTGFGAFRLKVSRLRPE